MGRIEQEYRRCCETPSDINEFLPLLKEYSTSCSHVTEFGGREVVPTWALLTVLECRRSSRLPVEAPTRVVNEDV